MLDAGMQTLTWVVCILLTSHCTVTYGFGGDTEELLRDIPDDIPVDDDTEFMRSTSELEVTRVRCLISQCKRKTGREYVECVTKCRELPASGQGCDNDKQARDKRVARPFWKRRPGARPSFWKRQSDPLQSCIEAHCTSAFHKAYGACVYEKCMHTLHMRLFRGVNKRSWNDMVHTCIAFHCGHQTPGTYSYSRCVRKACGNALIGER